MKAQKLRRIYRAKAASELWNLCDVLISPSTAITAPKIGEQTVTLASGQELEVRAASTLLVRAFNVLGTPAHSIVGGFHSNGLPHEPPTHRQASRRRQRCCPCGARVEHEIALYRLSRPSRRKPKLNYL